MVHLKDRTLDRTMVGGWRLALAMCDVSYRLRTNILGPWGLGVGFVLGKCVFYFLPAQSVRFREAFS